MSQQPSLDEVLAETMMLLGKLSGVVRCVQGDDPLPLAAIVAPLQDTCGCIEACVSTYAKASEGLKQSQAEVDARLARLESGLEAQAALVEATGRMKEQLAGQEASLREKEAQMKRHEDDMNAKDAQIQEEMAKYRLLKDSNNLELSIRAGTISTLETAREDMDRTIRDLRVQLETDATKMGRMQDALDGLAISSMEDMAKKQTELEGKQQEIEKITKDLSDSISNTEKRLREKQCELDQVRQQLCDNEVAQVKQLRENQEELGIAIVSLEEQMSDRDRELAAAQANLSSTIASLEDKISKRDRKIIEERANLNSTIASLKEQISNQDRKTIDERASLNSTIASLKEQISNKDKEITDERTTLGSAIASLEKQISRKDNELERRQKDLDPASPSSAAGASWCQEDLDNAKIELQRIKDSLNMRKAGLAQRSNEADVNSVEPTNEGRELQGQEAQLAVSENEEKIRHNAATAGESSLSKEILNVRKDSERLHTQLTLLSRPDRPHPTLLQNQEQHALDIARILELEQLLEDERAKYGEIEVAAVGKKRARTMSFGSVPAQDGSWRAMNDGFMAALNSLDPVLESGITMEEVHGELAAALSNSQTATTVEAFDHSAEVGEWYCWLSMKENGIAKSLLPGGQCDDHGVCFQLKLLQALSKRIAFRHGVRLDWKKQAKPSSSRRSRGKSIDEQIK